LIFPENSSVTDSFSKPGVYSGYDAEETQVEAAVHGPAGAPTPHAGVGADQCRPLSVALTSRLYAAGARRRVLVAAVLLLNIFTRYIAL